MTVEVESQEQKNQLVIRFVDLKFADLYPWQRYHYLSHLIPQKYCEERIANSTWIELAPGERWEDLDYPDEEFIASIASDVMSCLTSVRFFGALDDMLCPANQESSRATCGGDFKNSKSALQRCGVDESDFSDVFHVLMSKGGFCDCEVLYNVAENSRLGAEYWRARGDNRVPYDPHRRA